MTHTTVYVSLPNTDDVRRSSTGMLTSKFRKQNKYECTIDQEPYTELLAGSRRRTLLVHSPDGSTFLREMPSWILKV